MSSLIPEFALIKPLADLEVARLSALYRSGLLDDDVRPQLQEIVEQLASRIDVSMAWLDGVDARSVHRLACAGTGLGDPQRRSALTDTVIERNSLFVLGEPGSRSPFPIEMAAAEAANMGAYAGAPIRVEGKEPIAVISIVEARPRTFGSFEQGALTDACEQIGMTLDRQWRARTDAQTGSLDRQAFSNQAERMSALVGHGLEALSLAVLDARSLHEQMVGLEPSLGPLMFEFIAGLGREQVRRRDTFGRRDAFTFALLLAQTGAGGARVLARRMTDRLVGHWRTLMPAVPIASLIRVGTAVWEGRHDTVESFIGRAEDACRFDRPGAAAEPALKLA